MTINTDPTRLRVIGRANVFAQVTACLMAAKGDFAQAERMFAHRHPRSLHLSKVKSAVEYAARSAVTPGTTADSVWAAPLAPLAPFAQGFVEFLRPQTVIGRMSGFRRLPFNIRSARATVGATAGWVGEGRPTPATGMAFDAIIFKAAKIATIAALTKELVASSDPDATALVRDDLAAAVAQFQDQQFLDPTVDAVAGVRPASVTYGAPSVASSGSTAAAFATDFKALVDLISTNMTAPYLIIRPKTAVAIGAMDSHLTRNCGANGGTIGGIPVVTSANVPTDNDSPSDNLIVLIDAAEVFMNDGSIEIDASDRANVELNTVPSDPASASTEVISLFQHGLLGVKVVRFCNWQRRRGGSVAVLTGVGY